MTRLQNKVFALSLGCLSAFYSPYRLEYEQNRDMESRIKDLESSLHALEKDLEQIEKREAEAKSSAEKAIGEINRLNDEVEGMLWYSL